MPTLHKTTDIFSRRHLPSWMLLAFAAGSVNAAAFLACQRFVTHVTGTATRIGLDAAPGQWALVLVYVLVLVSFIVGAMASVVAIDGRFHRGRRPLYAVPLLTAAAILGVVALGGHAGLFGAFGAAVEQPADFALLCMLAFAMGLQNAAVTTSTGAAVRTTHMTGPATDLAIHLATSWFARGPARRTALRNAFLRAGKITCFVLGGAATVPLAARLGYLSFALPAAVVLVSTALSFVPAWAGLRAPQLEQQAA